MTWALLLRARVYFLSYFSFVPRTPVLIILSFARAAMRRALFRESGRESRENFIRHTRSLSLSRNSRAAKRAGRDFKKRHGDISPVRGSIQNAGMINRFADSAKFLSSLYPRITRTHMQEKSIVYRRIDFHHICGDVHFCTCKVSSSAIEMTIE